MRNAYHSECINIIDGKYHEAFFASDGSPDFLFVFVHGFNGHATKTWDSFSSMLLNDSFFANTDIIFYGYDSLKKQATAHAHDFFHFLNQELDFSETSESHLRALQRLRELDERSYKKIIIVAHSLGAIVVRESFLQANRLGKLWLDQIDMALFAPAHMGITSIKDLLFDIMDMTLILKLMARKIKYDHPILLDLERDSQILRKIREDTDELLKSRKNGFIVAKLVVHSSNDKVVSNVQFCDDPMAEEINNKSHSELCKPEENNYEIPINFIRQIM